MGRDRDRTIENLLGDALKRHAASASSDACLDAETAAAWTDGTLSGAERSRVERHAATCARCQALVAALVRTSPAPVRSSWFRLPRVAWLAPLTAAAAALLIWAIVPAPAEKSAAPVPPQANNSVTADRLVAEKTPPPPATAVAGARPPAANNPVPRAKEREKAFADRRQDVDALALAKKQDAKVADAKLKDEFDRQAQNQARVAQLQAPPASAAAPPAASPPAAPPPAAAPSEPKRDAGRGGAVAGAVAAAPAPAAADVAARKSVAESVVQNAARSRLEASQLPTIIATPNSNEQWRIINSPQRVVSTVEHSTDGGTTWSAQPFGLAATVTAGASPSPSVCWLVGPQGTVMLTTTRGAAWQRLAFPETVDLVAVRATDEANATVTAIDGRAFATTDRGVTWKPAR